MSETVGVWEAIGIWVEAIALIAIFVLDWKERKENRKERQEQHEENAAQLLVAQNQAEATRKSADAATEAALAARKSADIAASLHRPFMGVSNVALRNGWGTRIWHIGFDLKNYGTLPALSVGLTADVFTDNNHRMQTMESPSVQIFPSAEFVSIVLFDMGDPDTVGVHKEAIKLRIEVRIPYQSQDGRHFEHTATISFVHTRFQVDKSATLEK
jgi:hypothetical protein